MLHVSVEVCNYVKCLGDFMGHLNHWHIAVSCSVPRVN